MNAKKKTPDNCTTNTCLYKCQQCTRCGFDKHENRIRRHLRLIKGQDGLWRKLIPARNR